MARDFNATNGNYLSIADNGPSDITGTLLTVHAWINADVMTGAPAMVSKYNNTVNNQFILYHTAGAKLVVEVNDGVGVDTATGATSMPTGVWLPIGMVKNGTGAGSLKAFLNGVSDASITSTRTIHAGTSPLAIGGFADGTGIFDGRVAEVAIWDVGLSDAEMAALAKGSCPLSFRRDHLKGYWPLFGVGSPEPDLTGGGNATVNGTVPGFNHAPVGRLAL